MATQSQCPICGDDVGHLNNHIRMKRGDGHGSLGEYPRGWDKANEELDEELHRTSEGVDLDGETSDLLADTSDEADTSDDEDPGEAALDDPDAFDIDDLLEDTRTYECATCGEPIEYLGGDDADDGGKKCPECGETLYWSLVEP